MGTNFRVNTGLELPLSLWFQL